MPYCKHLPDSMRLGHDAHSPHPHAAHQAPAAWPACHYQPALPGTSNESCHDTHSMLAPATRQRPTRIAQVGRTQHSLAPHQLHQHHGVRHHRQTPAAAGPVPSSHACRLPRLLHRCGQHAFPAHPATHEHDAACHPATTPPRAQKARHAAGRRGTGELRRGRGMEGSSDSTAGTLCIYTTSPLSNGSLPHDMTTTDSLVTELRAPAQQRTAGTRCEPIQQGR